MAARRKRNGVFYIPLRCASRGPQAQRLGAKVILPLRLCRSGDHPFSIFRLGDFLEFHQLLPVGIE